MAVQKFGCSSQSHPVTVGFEVGMHSNATPHPFASVRVSGGRYAFASITNRWFG